MKYVKTAVHFLTVASSVLAAAAAVPGKVGGYATAALAIISGILHFIPASAQPTDSQPDAPAKP